MKNVARLASFRTPAIAAGLVLLAGLAAAHWYYSDRGRFTTEPQFTGLRRSVSSNELISPADPAVVLRFAAQYRHVGGQQFILYGVADTEQHFFVETAEDGSLKSLFWLQFEAYLPDNDYTYDYEDSPFRLSLGDYEFYADTDVVESDPHRKRRRGTDGALARQFLAGKGYSLPAEYAYARIVYLTDASRKELMIIFVDDLQPYGLAAADLKDGGRHAARRAEVEQAHLDRLRQRLTVLPWTGPPGRP